MPLTFKNPADYDKLTENSSLTLSGVFEGMENGEITLTDNSNGSSYTLLCSYTERQKAILKAGGLLPYTKQ